MAEFRIAYMYPHLMNLYGDRGNLLCLQKRLHWYGHQAYIKEVSFENKLDYHNIDMIYMGGGSDREVKLIYQDLISREADLKEAIENGFPMLFIDSAYQLLGQAYMDNEENIMGGLGFFKFSTRKAKNRLTGNIILNSSITGKEVTIVGFENHYGCTYFEDENLQPFGEVIKGFGNNGEDGYEGLSYKNLIGTCLHGPLLPKNPEIADFFIKAMVERRGITLNSRLDDNIENFARKQVIRREG
ncbi:MAG: glutamine amidotransferase, partial [Syntrophomonadaceae bacterium]|nr:glutamine amidotransferase [Syntrophomonadaceae bacterium]